MTTVIPSKKHIAQAFSRRAMRYNDTAFIQKHMLETCVGLIKKHDGNDSSLWLDAGCGIGTLGTILENEKIPVKLISSDIAFGALQNPQNRFPVCADLESLPFHDNIFSGVVAASVMQWLYNMDGGITEIARVIRQDGYFVYAAFLSGSFCELLQLRDSRQLASPVRYVDELELSSMIENAGFDIIEFSTEKQTHTFSTAWDVLRYFSDLGSTAQNGKRLSKQELMLLCREYEEKYSTTNGVSLSCVLGCGIAQKRK